MFLLKSVDISISPVERHKATDEGHSRVLSLRESRCHLSNGINTLTARSPLDGSGLESNRIFTVRFRMIIMLAPC